MTVAVLDRGRVAKEASAAANVLERTGRSSPLGAAVLPDGVNSSLDSPHDIAEWQTAAPVAGRAYRAGPRSVVVLFARVGEGTSPRL